MDAETITGDEKGQAQIFLDRFMPPGVPKNYPDAKKSVTEDCIKPAETPIHRII